MCCRPGGICLISCTFDIVGQFFSARDKAHYIITYLSLLGMSTEERQSLLFPSFLCSASCWGEQPSEVCFESWVWSGMSAPLPTLGLLGRNEHRSCPWAAGARRTDYLSLTWAREQKLRMPSFLAYRFLAVWPQIFFSPSYSNMVCGTKDKSLFSSDSLWCTWCPYPNHIKLLCSFLVFTDFSKKDKA